MNELLMFIITDLMVRVAMSVSRPASNKLMCSYYSLKDLIKIYFVYPIYIPLIQVPTATIMDTTEQYKPTCKTISNHGNIITNYTHTTYKNYLIIYSKLRPIL